MTSISALVRIVCGLALLALAYTTHARITDRVAAGETPILFGHPLGASPGELNLAFGVIALLGLALLALGLLSLIRGPK